MAHILLAKSEELFLTPALPEGGVFSQRSNDGLRAFAERRNPLSLRNFIYCHWLLQLVGHHFLLPCAVNGHQYLHTSGAVITRSTLFRRPDGTAAMQLQERAA